MHITQKESLREIPGNPDPVPYKCTILIVGKLSRPIPYLKVYFNKREKYY
jgi:hypothetical protein